MSNYFENKNNENFEWKRDEKDNPVIVVDHGDHKHKLNFVNSSATIGEFLENPNKVFGDMHRSSEHYRKK